MLKREKISIGILLGGLVLMRSAKDVTVSAFVATQRISTGLQNMDSVGVVAWCLSVLGLAMLTVGVGLLVKPTVKKMLQYGNSVYPKGR